MNRTVSIVANCLFFFGTRTTTASFWRSSYRMFILFCRCKFSLLMHFLYTMKQTFRTVYLVRREWRLKEHLGKLSLYFVVQEFFNSACAFRSVKFPSCVITNQPRTTFKKGNIATRRLRFSPKLHWPWLACAGRYQCRWGQYHQRVLLFSIVAIAAFYQTSTDNTPTIASVVLTELP